jgi:hypothetical protein
MSCPPDQVGFIPHRCKGCWLFVTFGDSGSRKQIAMSEERVANWKTLVNQWRNERSFRDELSHHLVFTKSGEEPGSLGEGCGGRLRQ